MRAQFIAASAVIAAALPFQAAFASGSATLLGGPQGTGYYGFVDPLDTARSGAITYPNAGAGATVPPELSQYDRNRDGVVSLAEYTLVNDSKSRRGAYSGPSWATNPPAPPQ